MADFSEFIAWRERVWSRVPGVPDLTNVTLAQYTRNGPKYLLLKDVIKIFNMTEYTIRLQCERNKLTVYKETRRTHLAAFKAASPDVQSKANAILTMNVRAAINLARILKLEYAKQVGGSSQEAPGVLSSFHIPAPPCRLWTDWCKQNHPLWGTLLVS